MVVAARPTDEFELSLQLPPLLLPMHWRLSPEQFEQVCEANPDAVLELSADGELIVMNPTGSETVSRNQALGALLWLAVRNAGLALKVFDSSGGFRLPDGSVLSPDAALVRLERWTVLNPDQRRGFAPLCPDLVVELASASDEGLRGVTALRQKKQRIAHAEQLDGGEFFPGLQIPLAEIWQG